MLKLFRKRNNCCERKLSGLLDGYQLPSFNSVVMNILGMLREPESLLKDISAQLEIDPGLHVKVLRMVNSAAFNLSTKVVNVSHAVTLLGRSRLESIVLSFAAKEAVPPVKTGFFNVNQFWLSAARRAKLAQALARHLHPATQAESFSAGFLQDIAVPIFMAAKKEEYAAIYDQWRKSGDSRLDVFEKESFGHDHPTVGCMMIKEWELPEYLGRMISGHHGEGESSEVEPAVRLVSHIRDSRDRDGTEKLIESCRDEFGMNPDLTTSMINKAFEEAEELSSLL